VSEIRQARVALWQAIDRARAVDRTDRKHAQAIIEGPAIALAQAVARCRCRDLAAGADLEHVLSVASEAVWASLPRIKFSLETAQVIRFLADRANHAVSDAAREADPLPRRARTYRNRVLAAAHARDGHGDEQSLRKLAREMYPQVTARTLDLMIQGAPPLVDVSRPDIEPALVATYLDPCDEVLDNAATDDLHIALADQPDASFRAWAARVLCGENDGRRLPRRLAPQAETVRIRLAAWA
jgi:hypothetical protein